MNEAAKPALSKPKCGNCGSDMRPEGPDLYCSECGAVAPGAAELKAREGMVPAEARNGNGDIPPASSLIRPGEDTESIIARSAQAAWRRQHPGEDCPHDKVPTPEALIRWINDMSESQQAEVMAAVKALLPPHCHDWPSEVVLVLHTALEALKPLERRPVHPFDSILEPVVAAWQARAPEIKEAEPYPVKQRAVMPSVHRTKNLPGGFPSAVNAPRQARLPGLGPAVGGCPSWLLWAFSVAGGESMAQGRGAPWTMRLWIGALLHLAIKDRDGDFHFLRFPVFDVRDAAGRIERPGVTSWLHPSGWQNRRRDWHRLPAALDAMRANMGYVPVPGLGSVAMLLPTIIPRAMSDPIVEFIVRVPKSAAAGARIDWPRLCRYGTESSALYRAYLAVSAHLDHSAHGGHAITREIGRRIRGKRRSKTEMVANPSARYVPVLGDADLARMIGYDGADRRRRFDARCAFERLDADNVIEFAREGKGWRVFGPRPPALPRQP